MESRKMVCIVCPMGCRMTVTRQDDGSVTVEGNTCRRGQAYAVDEFTDPKRVVTSSVPVEGGGLPLLSVKTNRPVPRNQISAVLAALQSVRARAPIEIGDVIASDIAGTGADIVATRRMRMPE